MSNLTIGLVFVTLLTAFMWLSQVAVLEINPEGEVFYNCEAATMISSFDKNLCQGERLLDSDEATAQGYLPSGAGAVEPSTGNIFTDTFASIKAWLTGNTKLRYVYGVLSAPANILKSMHIPNEVAFTLGAVWYGLNLFLLVAFLWGRDA